MYTWLILISKMTCTVCSSHCRCYIIHFTVLYICSSHCWVWGVILHAALLPLDISRARGRGVESKLTGTIYSDIIDNGSSVQHIQSQKYILTHKPWQNPWTKTSLFSSPAYCFPPYNPVQCRTNSSKHRTSGTQNREHKTSGTQNTERLERLEEI